MTTKSEGLIAEAVARATDAALAVAEVLASLPASAVDLRSWQEALAEVGEQTAVFRDAAAEVSNLFGMSSAQDRVLTYLLDHIGEVVTSRQLAGVSCIAEGHRRVRELRVEHGWPIETGNQQPGLRRDEYMLVASEPREELAEAWRLAKRIRGMQGSGQNRVLEYLKAISPEVADQDQLSYVAKIKSWQRRTRELDEAGWEIRSNIDEPNLAPGSYRLATLERRPPRAREAIKLRYRILERDDFTCQDCGAKPGQSGIRLQVHHVLPVHLGGTNDPENLLTLCEVDHAGRHAVLGSESVWDELVIQAREPDLATSPETAG